MTTSSSAVLPGPLTQAVDGAFNLRRAPLDACQGVGRSHTQVVVAVDGQLNARSLRNRPRIYAISSLHLRRCRIADGIRQVDDRRASRDGRPDDLCQEFPVAAGRILGGEFDIRGIFAGIGRHFADSAPGPRPASSCSLYSMCSGLVARNRWMRGSAASLTAFPGGSRCPSTVARAREATEQSLTCRAIACTRLESRRGRQWRSPPR